jgi:hypothetical protein
MANQPNQASAATGVQKYTGGCHCGAIRFEVSLDPSEPGSRCNCSICTKTSVTGRIVKPDAFTLLSGQEHLSTYEWGAKVSKRHFCKVCGVHSFGLGHMAQLGGDYVSVNLNCLDDFDPNQIPLIHWDGRHNNWQAGPRGAPWPIAPQA